MNHQWQVLSRPQSPWRQWEGLSAVDVFTAATVDTRLTGLLTMVDNLTVMIIDSATRALLNIVNVVGTAEYAFVEVALLVTSTEFPLDEAVEF